MNLKQIYQACGVYGPNFRARDVGITVMRTVRKLAQRRDVAAKMYLEDRLLDGIMDDVTQASHEKSAVMVSHNGQVIGVATVRAVRKTNPKERWYQQQLFTTWTWDDFYRVFDAAIKERNRTQGREAALRRLVPLHKFWPATVGPDAAAKLEGASVEAIMNGSYVPKGPPPPAQSKPA